MDRSSISSRQAGGMLLCVALVVGTFVRIVPLIGTDFPLGDGGLFAAIIADIQANGLLPPPHISYNQADLPFAYPPLSLEVAAVIGALTGVAAVDVLHWLPLVFSIATIPACYLLLRAITDSAVTAGIATVAFAVAPRSYEWLIVGGGLTRSLGLLFALLALWQLVSGIRTQDRRRMVWTGVFAGLTVLSHLSAAVFLVFSGLVLIYRFRASVRWLDLALAGAFAAVIVAPWLLFVVFSHGPDPLLTAGGSRLADLPGTLAQFGTLKFTDEFLFAPIALLGAIGFLMSLLRGPRWLLVWLFGPFLLASGDATTYAMVPWALLAALAFEEFLWPLTSSRARPAMAVSLLGLAVIGSIWTSYHEISPLHPLPVAVRTAMEEADARLDAEASVLVVSGAAWGLDASAEWFPFIAHRRSVGTAQGQEFSADGGWASALAAANDLQRCSMQGLTCIESWGVSHESPFNAVFIPAIPGRNTAGCCALLREQLQADDDWTTVYEGEGGLIVARRAASLNGD